MGILEEREDPWAWDDELGDGHGHARDIRLLGPSFWNLELLRSAFRTF